MPKIRASAIVLMSIASGVLLAGGLAYPLAIDFLTEFQERRAEERDFRIASELEQNSIVRSLITRETQERILCSPPEKCQEPIYFDRISAVLRSLDNPDAWEKHEFRSADRTDFFISRADSTNPRRLHELLAHVTQTQTENADPVLPGVIYVTSPEELPLLGEPEGCSQPIRPRLLRISRAAIQESQGIAVALVVTRYCDGSGSPRIATLKRDGAHWKVISDY